MGLVEIDWKPDSRKLRQFAVVWLIGFALAGCLVGWKAGVFNGSGKWTAPLVMWILAVIVGVFGILAPSRVRPIYVGWMAIAWPIGYVVTHVLFGIVYFGLFTPIAILLRLIGRDALQRKFDKEEESYWIKRTVTPSPKSYFNQF